MDPLATPEQRQLAVSLALLDAIAALAGALALQVDAGKLIRDLQFAQQHFGDDRPASAEAIAKVIAAVRLARPPEGSHEAH